MARLLMLTVFLLTACACVQELKAVRWPGPDGGDATYFYPLDSEPQRAVDLPLGACADGGTFARTVGCSLETFDGKCRSVKILDPAVCDKTPRARRVELTAGDSRGVRYVADPGQCPIPFAVIRDVAEQGLKAAIASRCFDVPTAEAARVSILKTATVSTDELLDQRYAFRKAELGDGSSVDLLPGMRLRVEYATYPRPLDADVPADFVGSGTAFYALSSVGSRREFDPFLARTYSNLLVDENLASRRVFSPLELIDLNAMPYLRLYYPKQLKRATDSGLPSEEVGDNAVVVRAGSSFEARASEPDQDNCLAKDAARQTKKRQCMFFRQQGLPIPEILVELNGTSTWVSVGTTVRNVVECSADLSDPATRSGLLEGLELRRRHEGKLFKVSLQSLNDAAFEIPLIQGDQVKW